MIDPLEFGQAPAPAENGAAASAVKDPPSLEGLLYAAGMVSADQLGELVRDAVLTQRPVAEIALERGFATVDVMEKLLGQVGLSLADVLGEAEPAPQAAVPGPEAAVAPPLADVLRVTLPGPPAPAPAQAAVPVPVPAPDQIVVAPLAPPVPTIPLAVEPAPVSRPTYLLSEPVAPVPPVASAEASTTFAILVRLQTGERVAVDSAKTFEAASELALSLAGRFARAGEWPLFGGRCIRPEAVVSIDIERTLDG